MGAPKETLGFQAEVKQLLQLMIHSLYSNKEIFLRELISNGADACEKLRYAARQNDSLLAGDSALAVTIVPDKDAGTLTIEDNGIGMDRETREKVFSLFFSSKGIKGTGLGLFISNKIVDKHGGSIDVESEPGRGSRFLVRLPLEARPSTRPAEVAS